MEQFWDGRKMLNGKRSMRAMTKPAIRPEDCAVLIIDMQNEFVKESGKFVEPNSYYAKRVRSIIKPIKELVGFVSQAGIPIIYTKTMFLPNYCDAPRISISREMGALQRGSKGTEIIDELTPKGPNNYIVEAQRYDKFFGTNLELLLHGLGRQTLIFTGTATSVCVESTARTARERDYFPIVVSDCTASFEQTMHDSSLEIMGRFFGSVLTAEELIHILSGK